MSEDQSPPLLFALIHVGFGFPRRGCRFDEKLDHVIEIKKRDTIGETFFWPVKLEILSKLWKLVSR